MRILVVEDDKEIQELITYFLSKEGYEVDQADDGLEGLRLLKEKQHNLVVLDLMLPNLDGKNFTKIVKGISSEYGDPAIIMLTAKTEIEDVLEGLEIGADDYMTKPFDLHELLARIEANLKRTSNTSCQNDTLTYRDIEINNSLVYIKEVLVSFTSTELKILRLLLQYPQKIFSKQNLYESIWNKTYAYDDDTINTHISHIRKKIKAITNEDYIQTIWGIGYKIK